jgi:hypothetical protein
MPLIVGAAIAGAVLLVFWLTPKPQPPLPPPRRLANGTIISGQPLKGNGRLTIDNGTSRDAVIKIVDSKTSHALEAFYIQGQNQVSIGQIPDGDMIIYFASGMDFDPVHRGFTREKGFSRFVDTLPFTTSVAITASGTQSESTTFTITLHPVVNGTAKTNTVDEADFERL